MVQLSRAGRVENRFGELFQRGVQGTEVVANVRVGPGLAERDRTEHPRMTPVRPILFANRTSELATSPLTAMPVTLDKEGTGGSLGRQRAQQVHLTWALGHGSSTSDAGGWRRIEVVCDKEVLLQRQQFVRAQCRVACVETHYPRRSHKDSTPIERDESLESDPAQSGQREQRQRRSDEPKGDHRYVALLVSGGVVVQIEQGAA